MYWSIKVNHIPNVILLSIIFTTKQIIDVIIFFSLRLRVRGGVIG